MDNSSEDDDLFLITLIKHKRKLKKKREFWVHPLSRLHPVCSNFVKYKHLNRYPRKFKSFFRMHPDTHKSLLLLVGPHLGKKDTKYRNAVPVEERLMITIRSEKYSKYATV